MKWQHWRKWGLVGMAVILAVAIYFPGNGRGESASAATAVTKPSVHKPPQQDSHVELERLERKKAAGGTGTGVGDAFTPTSWYVAPPPPPPAPPPPPTAPPMPFTYLGRYQDSTGELIMLARGDRLYTVTEGAEIDGTYRVKHIGSNAVDLVYLPMNIEQSISTTEASADAQSQAGAIRRP